MSNDYPHAPGWKREGTSHEAAEFVKKTAPTWMARCLATIEAAPQGLTANQVAIILKHDHASIRPRITQLLKLNKVHSRKGADGKELRRPTGTGCSAIVWFFGPDPEQNEMAEAA